MAAAALKDFTELFPINWLKLTRLKKKKKTASAEGLSTVLTEF